MHHHGHSQGKGLALRVSLVATLTFTAFEVWAAIHSHSLSLLSDAGHNFTDAFALLLAVIGLRWQQKPADQSRTYGYQRAGVLAAFINALTLIAISLFIFWEAGRRLVLPEQVNAEMMSWVAICAVVLNGSIMAVLHSGQKGDINIRAAFVHMMGDMLGGLAILIGALIIHFTGWLYIDPLLSIAIGLLIIYTAWDITRESLNILLEGLPHGMKLDDISLAMVAVEGVIEVHDLHVWSLGTRTHALSSHVLIQDMPQSESTKILDNLNSELCNFGIHHTTIQFEHVPCFLAKDGCQMNEAARDREHQHNR